MELADLEAQVFQQSGAAICQGQGRGPAHSTKTGEPASSVLRALTAHQHVDLVTTLITAAGKTKYWVKDVVNSFSLRLCLLYF